MTSTLDAVGGPATSTGPPHPRGSYFNMTTGRDCVPSRVTSRT